MKTTSKIARRLTAALLFCGVLALSGQPQNSGLPLSRTPPANSKPIRPRKVEGNAVPPSVIFWAWERPEDLSFLDPAKAGVAFLAETIQIRANQGQLPKDKGPRVVLRSRLQPLRVSPQTRLIAVVRIETSTTLPPDNNLQSEIAAEIAALRNLRDINAVQIDFDATSSERAFYSALLQEVRRQLPASVPLSITALGSWCIGDPWLAALPPGTIDEAVPMLFRMGLDASNISRFLRTGDDFPVAACRGSLGLSIDESVSRDVLGSTLTPDSPHSRNKRIYVFSPHAWTKTDAETVLQELKP